MKPAGGVWLLVLIAAGCAVDEGTVAPGLAAADSIVAAWVEAGTVAGAVLSVARDGETLLERAYGHSRLYDYGPGQYGRVVGGRFEPRSSPRVGSQARVPMRVGVAFDLASLTKVMATTFAVMLLVEDDRLDLDAPVSDVLPDFVGGGKERITIRHLLTHRAGLSQWQPTYYAAADREEAYAYVRDLPLAWPVGEARHYSDLGFMVLGRVIETRTGKRLDHFLTDELYAPLELLFTRFIPRASPTSATRAMEVAATSHGNPFEYRMVYDTTFGYRFEGRRESWDGWRQYTLVGEVNDGNAFYSYNGVAGHAGLFSTAAELQTLLLMLLPSGRDGARFYFAPSVVEHFLEDAGDRQALGWQVPDYAPPGSFTHTGFTGTWVLGVPEIGLSVVLLTNRQHGGVDPTSRYPDLGPLQRAVAVALLDRGDT